jgi:predicted HicB family RNase H-like nuclease
MLKYKGYIGHAEYDDEFQIFHGDVINMNHVVTFQGKTVDELEQAFRDSIDDYLQWAKEDGFEPEKPFSGNFMVRVEPELHKAATIAAKKSNMSLNAWMVKAIEIQSHHVRDML